MVCLGDVCGIDRDHPEMEHHDNAGIGQVSQVREITEEYRLLKVLRTAAQSTVFQAADPRTEQLVIIKLLNPVGPVV